MATDKKRKHEDTSEQRSNKKKRGFKVGPDNLPDGTYLRKGLRQRGKTTVTSLISPNSQENQVKSDPEGKDQEGLCQSQGQDTR
jgi:hypothetical protein